MIPTCVAAGVNEILLAPDFANAKLRVASYMRIQIGEDEV